MWQRPHVCINPYPPPSALHFRFSPPFQQKMSNPLKWLNFWKVLPPFNYSSILQNIRMSNLVILKWGFFKYKAEFKSEIGIFDIFFKRLYEKCFEDLQINSNSKFETRVTISHKKVGHQSFCKTAQKSYFNS